MNYVLVKGGLLPVPIHHSLATYKAIASVASFGSVASSTRDAAAPNTRPLEDFIARRILGQLSELPGDG